MAKLTEEQVQQVMDIIQSTPAPLVPKTVREYIGARYVPVFANPLEWSDTREYEPLTIVTYQGNSYTSMQYVPTGIEITNTSFWALTGNYNAQIEQYRQEVQAFDGRISENAADIKTLQQGKDGIMIFGDSWFEAESFRGSHSISYWLEQNTHETVECYAAGGATFTTHTGNSGLNGSVDAQVAKAMSETSLTNDNVKYIVFGGGVNDFRKGATSQQFYEGLTVMINTLKTKFPNAKIVWFSNCSFPSGYKYLQWYGSVAYNMAALMTSYSLANALTYEDVNTDDYLHPNATGYKNVAQYVYACLNGSTPYVKFNTIQVNLANGEQKLNLSLSTYEENGCMRVSGRIQGLKLPENAAYANITTLTINRDMTMTCTNGWSVANVSTPFIGSLMPNMQSNIGGIDVSLDSMNLFMDGSAMTLDEQNMMESFKLSFGRKGNVVVNGITKVTLISTPYYIQ